MTYTIQDVSENVRDIKGQYGPLKVYKLKLEGESETVDYLLSPASPTPRIGDIIEGIIGHNSFGAYFKKDKKPFTPGGGDAKRSPIANTDAMFVSYAKDMYIAYLNTINWDFTKLDDISFNLLMSNVKDAADILRQTGDNT